MEYESDGWYVEVSDGDWKYFGLLSDYDLWHIEMNTDNFGEGSL